MKSFYLFLFAILATFSAAAQEWLHLSTGQSFTYTFSSATFIQPGALLLPGGGVRYFTRQPVPNTRVLIELFENDFSEAPIASGLVNDTPSDGTPGSSLFKGGIWQDLQGAVRLTVVEGEMDLTSFQYRINTSVPDFNTYLTVVSIPEPRTLSLLLLGGSVVAFVGLRRWSASDKPSRH